MHLADGDADFRAALHAIVAASDHDTLSVVDGTESMDPSGLGAHLLHPSDTGMVAIGEGFARHLEQRLE